MKKADLILQRVIQFCKLAQELLQETPQVFYRVQPKGKGVTTHTSGLAYEKVPGIFAFEDPKQLFDTYTWLHVKKHLDDYEMISLLGILIDHPTDSEGVVVKPEGIIQRTPLKEWIKQNPP